MDTIKDIHYIVQATPPDRLKDLSAWIVANKENPLAITEFLDAMQDLFNDKMKEAYDKGWEDAYRRVKEDQEKLREEEMRLPPRL